LRLALSKVILRLSSRCLRNINDLGVAVIIGVVMGNVVVIGNGTVAIFVAIFVIDSLIAILVPVTFLVPVIVVYADHALPVACACLNPGTYL
jgi:hypothetical protein